MTTPGEVRLDPTDVALQNIAKIELWIDEGARILGTHDGITEATRLLRRLTTARSPDGRRPAGAADHVALHTVQGIPSSTRWLPSVEHGYWVAGRYLVRELPRPRR